MLKPRAHKVAAKILGASCNGWTYWHYKLGSNFVPIDNLRQKFLVSKNYHKSYQDKFLKTFYFSIIFLRNL